MGKQTSSVKYDRLQSIITLGEKWLQLQRLWTCFQFKSVHFSSLARSPIEMFFHCATCSGVRPVRPLTASRYVPAGKRFLSRMNSHVPDEILTPRKRFSTERTDKGFLFRMNASMIRQRRGYLKGLLANIAFVRLFIGVQTTMEGQLSQVVERFWTIGTFVLATVDLERNNIRNESIKLSPDRGPFSVARSRSLS